MLLILVTKKKKRVPLSPIFRFTASLFTTFFLLQKQTMMFESNYNGIVANDDAYNARLESRLVMEDNVTKKAPKAIEVISVTQQQQTPSAHVTSVKVHNPYSLTNALECKFQCSCTACTGVAPVVEVASAFMPPPPPRLDTYDVISFCGAEDPDTVIYNMMVRWFTKVSAVQQRFVAEDNFCPEPKPSEYDFVEWCRQVNEWWYENFEHRQKKAVAAPARRPW